MRSAASSTVRDRLIEQQQAGKKVYRLESGDPSFGVPQDTTRAMVAEYQVRRDAVVDGLAGARLLHAVRPEGAFYMWCRIDEAWPGHEGERDSWAMTRFLIGRAAVGSAPGIVFGPAGHDAVRFAFACSTDQVTDAAKRLGELLG